MRNLLIPIFLLLLVLSCKHPQPEPGLPAGNDTSAASGYPVAIGQIIKQKCLSCHNADNAKYSGGLRLDTWDYLMAGGSVGPDVIPYHLDNSVLLQYINTYDDLGLQLNPTMPVDGVPLTHDQVKLFQDWIMNGAPNKEGYVAFSSDPDTRQKIYITMQSCDLLAVIDAETRMIMRMIPVGKKKPGSANPEVAHCVRVDHAGRYAYVALAGGEYVQKIDARTDQVVGEINLNRAMRKSRNDISWSVITISKDDKQFVISNWSSEGQLFIVNTADMTLAKEYSDAGVFKFPHATAANAAFDTFYVTSQYGNTVYKFGKGGDPTLSIAIDGNRSTPAPALNPHEIVLLPGDNVFAVTCEKSNEVRFIDAHTDAVLAAIPVGRKPQEFALSTTQPYLFVTCEDDAQTPVPAAQGSVYVINYLTRQIVKVIYGPFWQPHGIAVDDRNGKVYVASQNVAGGIASHHATSCIGKNGFYHVIDLKTLTLERQTRYEAGVWPYSADVRFKN